MGDVVRLNYESPTNKQVASNQGLGSVLDKLITTVNGLVAAMQGGSFVLKAPTLGNTTTALAIGATPYQVLGVQAWRTAGTVALTATTHDVAINKWAAYRVSVASGGTATITKDGTDRDTLALALANVPAVPTGEVDFGYFVVRGGNSAIFDATTTNLASGAVTGMLVHYYPAQPLIAAVPALV